MRKIVAERLREKAEQYVTNFSRPDRENNFNQETFEIERIVPLSEATAVVVAKKNTGKLSLAFFYCIKLNTNPCWNYFVPTESHVYGMKKLAAILHKIEKDNFPQNFIETDEGVDDAVEEMFKEVA